MNKVCKYLCDKKIDVDRIDEEIENYRIQRMHAGDQQEREEVLFIYENSLLKTKN